MKLIFILFFLLIIYIADICICMIYCKKKKKIDLNNKNKLYVDVSTRESVCDNSTEKMGKIKRLINGWVFYRVKRLAKIPCQKYRIFILKHVFQMDIAEKVVIYEWDIIRAPWNISIGKGTVVGHDVSLDGRNHIKIGENVNISTGVNIYTEQHDVNDPFFRSLDSGGSVIVNDRAWISSHTVILPKVEVGEGAVLASGALATKSLRSYSIYGGIPAKKLGERTVDLRYEFDGSYLPFI